MTGFIEHFQFLDGSAALGQQIPASHDPVLVVMSYLVAAVASYAALAHGERIEAADNRKTRLGWALAGAVAMGCGVWAMHFIGMLAFQLAVPVAYDPLITAISILPAFLASAAALYLVRERKATAARIMGGGVILGAGIGAMHYTGMAAMRLAGDMYYDPVYFLLSIVVAVLLASGALYVKLMASRGAGKLRARLGSAAIMGAAVAGMHYTAMAAARFYYSPGSSPDIAARDHTVMAAAVAAIAIIVVGLTIIAVVIDRRLETAASAVRDNQQRLFEAIENISEGFFLFDTENNLVMHNEMARHFLPYRDSVVPDAATYQETVGAILDSGPRNFPERDAGEAVRRLNARQTTSSEHKLTDNLWVRVNEYLGETGDKVCVVTDISASKQIESELERRVAERTEALSNSEANYCKLYEEMEIRVDERTRELGEANRNLRATLINLENTQTKLMEAEKMASIAGMVAGIAHEINTPVGVGITAASHVTEAAALFREKAISGGLKKSDLDVFLDTVDQSMGIVSRNLDRASLLVKSFKQIAVDPSDDDRAKFNAREHIEDVIRGLDKNLNANDHVFEMDCDSEVILDSYPRAYEQILESLISNSLIHGFGDGPQGTVRITLIADPEGAMLEYSDDGRGMDEDHVRQVFQPFFTTSRGAGNSGLGMSVVYNLVTQKLKGAISCKSKPGEGVTFTIAIPTLRPEEEILNVA